MPVQQEERGGGECDEGVCHAGGVSKDACTCCDGSYHETLSNQIQQLQLRLWRQQSPKANCEAVWYMISVEGKNKVNIQTCSNIKKLFNADS